MSEKKYYWLRLKRDFFKRHDIQIIESMPNGKDYILFYLKLLCESVDHDGNLRFSDEIPYNEQMLSTITNTNVDIVRTAITAFVDLKMMEILDDGTYYMSGVEKLIGCMESDEHTRESAKLRMRKYREKKKQELLEQKEDESVTVTSPLRNCNVTRYGEIELEIEKEKRKNNKKENPSDLFERLYPEFGFSDSVVSALSEWYAYKTERKDKFVERGMRSQFKEIQGYIDRFGDEYVIAVVNKSMARQWVGLTWDSVKGIPKKHIPEPPKKEPRQEEVLDIRNNYTAYPKDTWTEDEIEDAVSKGIITENEAHEILWG